MLTSTLCSLVKGLNRLQEIEGGLRARGRRHRDYNGDRADREKFLQAPLLSSRSFWARILLMPLAPEGRFMGK
jgi:hypothetical protein